MTRVRVIAVPAGEGDVRVFGVLSGPRGFLHHECHVLDEAYERR
jgi:hypothetical protein